MYNEWHHSLLYVGCRLVMMAVGLVPWSNILIDVTVELSSERVLSAGHHCNVLHGYRLGGRLASAHVAIVHHHGSGRVGPVQVVPAVQLQPMPFSAVGILSYTTLDSHQERANRQHQETDVQEPGVTARYDGRHDQ